LAIKRWLSETFGKKCSVCGIEEWNKKDIVFELEHKDGNSENNSKDNVCLICPNCHSQTDTYKGKNKGNGRHSRRQRYTEGKSY
jgi:heterodisulfide reductase subunit B